MDSFVRLLEATKGLVVFLKILVDRCARGAHQNVVDCDPTFFGKVFDLLSLQIFGGADTEVSPHRALTFRDKISIFD